MFNKFEITVGAFCVLLMGAAIYLTQFNSILFQSGKAAPAQVVSSGDTVVVVEEDGVSKSQARANAYLEASDKSGNIKSMVIDDIKIGTGEEVKEGDTVAVHYVGTLQDGGEEFDNSRKRGTPFEFKVGAGMVIKGWDEGLVGMKVGGQRVLVIPPDMAYGEQGIGPIPPNSTLVFAIELVDIK